ncbi:hypothetical protein BDB00DRAFT_928314 [Zychaea mexicana]|uniref:uncharacterized protein n=1 Tax=Zychaea mexicana TaxID=64656 RepID=UPI0022FE2FF6|nr:uncharacterized protein BDB00DRAFT_928314 [Zychaea mexicana]KAI9494409.1 hypothetical protein BDB00DRAFT_928314 [Zychaea mexicana]
MSSDYVRSLLQLHPEMKKDARTIPLWRKRFLLGLALPSFRDSAQLIIFQPWKRITAELNSPTIMMTLSNSLYMMFMGIAVSAEDQLTLDLFIIIYTADFLGGCFAYDIYVLLGMRILQAVGISSAWAVGAGSVADVYGVDERGNALSPRPKLLGAGWVTFFFGMLSLVWAFFVLALKVNPQMRKYSGN